MNKTSSGRTSAGQSIGGLFSDQDEAKQARYDFLKEGIIGADIEIIQAKGEPTPVRVKRFLAARQFKGRQAAFYVKALRKGDTLVIVHQVRKPFPILAIFDKYGARYDPGKAHNLLEDEPLAVGSASGAATGAIVGGTLAGPPGALGGAVTGALIAGGMAAAVHENTQRKIRKRKASVNLRKSRSASPFQSEAISTAS